MCALQHVLRSEVGGDDGGRPERRRQRATFLVRLDDDDLGGTGRPRPLQRGEADRPGALHDGYIPEPDAAAVYRVEGHGRRLDLRRFDGRECRVGAHDPTGGYGDPRREAAAHDPNLPRTSVEARRVPGASRR